jgi:quinol monooxygenase YgiN
MARQPSRDSTDANTPAQGGPFSHDQLADIAALSALERRERRRNTMTERVSWVNELAVKAGKLQTFRELMEEMVSGARDQPGTIAYEWYISADGGTVHVVETYANSAAVVAHHVSEGFALKNWAGRFMDCVDVTRVTAYGDPNAAAREILDRLGATYHSAWGGFARF